MVIVTQIGIQKIKQKEKIVDMVIVLIELLWISAEYYKGLKNNLLPSTQSQVTF